MSVATDLGDDVGHANTAESKMIRALAPSRSENSRYASRVSAGARRLRSRPTVKTVSFLTALPLILFGCATIENEPGADLGGLAGETGAGGTGTGGLSTSTGGSPVSSGGVLGAGATTNTGGTSMTGGSSTGGSATGGSSTGGASTGGAGTGGTSTGGASTGGSATGGTVGTGDCAGVEQFVAGASTKYAQGAKVVDECATSIPCTGKSGLHEFTCNDQYNCGGQDPGTTNWSQSPWLLSKECNP